MSLSLPAKLLIGLCLVHLIANIFWLNLNHSPIPWDQAGHTRLAIEYARYFQGTLHKVVNPLAISSYYPPLTHVVVSAFIAAFGPHIDLAAFVISLYFIALLIGIYLLIKALTKEAWVGLLTAAFFSFYLPVYENARWFLLDIPLVTLLVYAWYFLHQSKNLTRWKESFIFGLCCIGVFLTKWIGITFLFIPTVFVAIDIFRKGASRTQLAHIYSIIVLIVVAIFPWYYTNSHRLVEIGRLASQGEITDPQRVWSAQNLLFYFTHILNFQLTLWPALVALVSSVLYFTHKRAPYKKLIATFLIFGYGFFTFISNKDIRYTIPLLLPLAGMTAYVLVHSLKEKRLVPSIGAGIIAASLMWLVVQFSFLSFHLLPHYQRAWNLGILGWIDYINTGDIVVSYPKPDTSPNQSILSFITQRQKGQAARILVGVDQPTTNPSTLDLDLTIQNLNYLGLAAPFELTRFESEQHMLAYMENFTYYVIPTGEVGPDATRHKAALQQMQYYILNQHPDRYEILATYPAGNGAGEIHIVRKK